MQERLTKGGALLAGAALVVTGCSSEKSSDESPTASPHSAAPQSTPATEPSNSHIGDNPGYDISYPQA
jgi:hypothetical protein